MEQTFEPSYLKSLNPAQKQAVLKTEGALLIVAGAGAGKTKTITHRILHLIKSGVAPRSILAITFTNKAAGEMRERVRNLIETDPSLNQPVSLQEFPFISTFHSLGVRIIKEWSGELGLPRHFSIFDRDDSKKAIKDSMVTLGIDPKSVEPGKILSFISKQKGDAITIKDATGKEARGYFEEVALKVWQEYENTLKKEKALDFDDLLAETLFLLRKEHVRKHYNALWRYIHIDEYQDTNRVQYDIAKLLAEEHRNIAVVGDIDQSIYSWRGADFKNIMRFEKDYPEREEVVLEENYRSTKTILRAANDVIVKNIMRKDKNLFTQNEDGDQISLYVAFDENDEASYISRTVKMLIDQGVNPKEIAILYRANFQSRVIEEAFVRKGLAYDLIGTKFFERKEVKDVISYIKASLNNDSLTDIKRVINTPPRGVGKVTLLTILEGKEDSLTLKTLEKVREFRNFLAYVKQKSAHEKPSEVVKYVIKFSGLETMYMKEGEEGAERLENMRELVNIAQGYDAYEIGEGMEKFLEHVVLSSDQDEIKEEKNSTRLMTVHASKGLEFDYVFITGLEQDLFPHARLNGDEKGDGEEERRLFYVALTRARKKLHLSYAQMRTIFGSRQMNTPSIFLSDIGDELLQYENSGSKEVDWNSGFLRLDDIEF